MVQPASRADARANRERLLAAAVSALAERGIDVEIREIAERAGLSVGALYRHFPSKEDLIAAVFGEAITEFERLVTAALACPDPLAGLRGLIRDGLAVAERYGEPMGAVLEGRVNAGRQPHIAQSRRALLRQQIAEVIRRGVEAGVLRSALDPEVAAAMLAALFVPRSLAHLRATRTAGEITDAVVALFLPD